MNNNASWGFYTRSSSAIEYGKANNRLILHNRRELIGITKASGIDQAILKVIETTVYKDGAVSRRSVVMIKLTFKIKGRSDHIEFDLIDSEIQNIR